mgnify:CR=1 FL=1
MPQRKYLWNTLACALRLARYTVTAFSIHSAASSTFPSAQDELDSSRIDRILGRRLREPTVHADKHRQHSNNSLLEHEGPGVDTQGAMGSGTNTTKVGSTRVAKLPSSTCPHHSVVVRTGGALTHRAVHRPKVPSLHQPLCTQQTTLRCDTT